MNSRLTLEDIFLLSKPYFVCQFLHMLSLYITGGIGEKFTTEVNRKILPRGEYATYFRSLNTEQRQVVIFHREWCKKTVSLLRQHKPVVPYHLFLSGPGGVGKSYVIKMIHSDTVKYLSAVPGIESDDIIALLTATTGVAAFNIEGMTVDSAFQLFNSMAQGRSKRAKAQDNTYIPLSSDARSTLRKTLHNLFVVIIDEVSMLSADKFYKIHMRLQEIMNVRHPDTRFGNVTIIAVGDLYQLPAIGTRVYDLPGRFAMDDIRRLHGSLWKENFMLHELTQVVRQKDPQFAGMLNRLRTAQQTAEDEEVLLSRVIELDDPSHDWNALHVYGTNDETDAFNEQMVRALNEPVYTMHAHDVLRSTPSQPIPEATLRFLETSQRKHTGNMQTVLKLCKGAMVKVTSNVDTSDGLCNGARGVIKDFIMTGSTIQVVFVQFENAIVGNHAKATSPYKRSHPDLVPIVRHANSFNAHQVGINRKQFPLVLAFASTVHSVQGLTVDRIVCDMNKVRANGQFYVAVSRVRTLQGLQILNFRKNAIKRDPCAEVEMERLRKHKLPVEDASWMSEEGLKICYMNVDGYLPSHADVRMDNAVQLADVITFTESHLQSSQSLHLDVLPKPGLQVFRHDRSNVAKGGVLTFVPEALQPEPVDCSVPELEHTVVNLPQEQLTIITMYRRPGSAVPLNTFIDMCDRLLSSPPLLDRNILIVGDFNEEVGGQTSDFFTSKGFQQLQHGPTTDMGSTIDHVYYNGVGDDVHVQVLNRYYSDHDMLIITLKK